MFKNIGVKLSLFKTSIMITLWPEYEEELERELEKRLSAPGLTREEIREIGQKYEPEWLNMNETGREIWVETRFRN